MHRTFLDEGVPNCYYVSRMIPLDRVFRKLPSGKKSEHVAQQLLQAIHDGFFKLGDRLPAVDEIAQHTGVSRPTVREGIVALRLLGIVESKAGSGTYVTKTDLDPRDLHHLLADEVNPFAALEARSHVEPIAAKLAIGPKGSRDMSCASRALERMRASSASEDLEALYRADRAFHLCIAEASGNEFISAFIKQMLDVFLESGLGEKLRHSYLIEKGFRERSLEQHVRIFEVLQVKDIHSVDEVFGSHFAVVEAQILDDIMPIEQIS